MAIASKSDESEMVAFGIDENSANWALERSSAT
jgi:hypothetical protein